MIKIDRCLTQFDIDNERFTANFHEQKWQMKLESMSINDMLGKGHGIMIRYIQPLYVFHMSVIETLNNKVTNEG